MSKRYENESHTYTHTHAGTHTHTHTCRLLEDIENEIQTAAAHATAAREETALEFRNLVLISTEIDNLMFTRATTAREKKAVTALEILGKKRKRRRL